VTVSADESPADSSGPPPFRIWHIFLATAVTALILTAQRVLEASKEVGATSGLAIAWTILELVTTGLAVAFVGIGVFCRRAGWSFLQQPGHWLLLLTPLTLLNTSLWHFYYLNGNSWWILTLLLPIPGTATLILPLVAAWKWFGSVWWRIFFLAEAVCSVVPFITPFSSNARLIYGLICSVSLLALIASATSRDLQRSSRRGDWLHWSGVALAAFNLAKGLAIYLFTAIGA
jgi:hypothetical protein